MGVSEVLLVIHAYFHDAPVSSAFVCGLLEGIPASLVRFTVMFRLPAIVHFAIKKYKYMVMTNFCQFVTYWCVHIRHSQEVLPEIKLDWTLCQHPQFPTPCLCCHHLPLQYEWSTSNTFEFNVIQLFQLGWKEIGRNYHPLHLQTIHLSSVGSRSLAFCACIWQTHQTVYEPCICWKLCDVSVLK